MVLHMSESESWLPIGSVVHVVGNEGLYFIIGYMRVATDGRLWDYVARVYPMGYMGPNTDMFCDRDVIDRVYYLGYQDETWDTLKSQLIASEAPYGKIRKLMARGMSFEDAVIQASRNGGISPLVFFDENGKSLVDGAGLAVGANA